VAAVAGIESAPSPRGFKGRNYNATTGAAGVAMEAMEDGAESVKLRGRNESFEEKLSVHGLALRRGGCTTLQINVGRKVQPGLSPLPR